MREFLFVQLSRRQGQDGVSALRVIRHEAPSIEYQEQLDRDKGRVLVAINNGVIADQAESVSRRQGRCVGLAILGQMARALYG